ncbi:MAG: hypothetical protein WCI11_02850 [Candidatus Methylumidiphilus sp.]
MLLEVCGVGGSDHYALGKRLDIGDRLVQQDPVRTDIFRERARPAGFPPQRESKKTIGGRHIKGDTMTASTSK